MKGANRMNMKDFCATMHVSKPTIYKRIKEAGLELQALRDPDGNLTPEAITTLSALLDNTSPKSSKRNSDNPRIEAMNAAEDPVSYAALLTDIETLTRERDEARASLEAANAKILELQSEALERERAHADAWRQLSERQQELEARRLLGPGPGGDGRSVWQRIRAVFKPDKE